MSNTTQTNAAGTVKPAWAENLTDYPGTQAKWVVSPQGNLAQQTENEDWKKAGKTVATAAAGVLLVAGLNAMSGPIHQDTAKPAPAISSGIREIK